MTLSVLWHSLWQILLWGFFATSIMTTVLYGSQGLGLSRISLPYLAGTMFTANPLVAEILGYITYLFGGWFFAAIYYFIFVGLEVVNWWLGAFLGFLHGIFILAVALPLLPYIHPRIATEYEGPSAKRRLEPPGFMGLNYGLRTPMTTMVGQIVYGGLLGFFYKLPS